MRIKRLVIENFRIFKDKTTIDFDDLTAFIGKNDIGKSTILDALDIFFNGKDAQGKLDKEDITKGSESPDITISVLFDDYPPKLIIDADVETSLEEEFLLNSEGLLELRKVYQNGDLKKEKIFIIASYPNQEKLKDLFSLKINELKKRAEELGVDLSNEDKRIASVIRKRIRDKILEEEQVGYEETKIPITEESTKQIWNKLKDYLPVYALFKADRPNIDQDSEIQDPMKIAIKKIIREEELRNKLKEIQDEVKNTVKEIAKDTIEKLKEMNPEIAEELRPDIPEPKWENVFKGITIKSDKDIPLNKRGSGVRRLILLNFFRAEAEKKKDERDVPTIIYAFEEPEVSQHPEHQKILINAFLELSSREDTQIVLTTHSPGIAGLLPADGLRYLHWKDGKVVIEKGTEEILSQIAESLGILPSVDKTRIEQLRLIVCVEGPTDIEFLKRLGQIIEEKLKIDFENDKQVVIIPLGGSTLKYWVDNHYLRKLELPEIHIYDGDKGENREKANQVSSRGDESKGFVTNKLEIENYVHPEIIEEIFYELSDNSLIDRTRDNWIEDWDQMDVPEEIKKMGVPIRKIKIKEKICTEGVEKMTIELFRELEAYDEIKTWFESIKEVITE